METIQTDRALMWLWIVLGVVLLTLLLVNKGYAGDNFFYDGLSSREKNVARYVEKKYLTGKGKAVLRFRGDAEISEHERIESDVVIIKGSLTIDGEVDGHVLAVFGDVCVHATAEIHGDVISVNGKVWTNDAAMIHGDVVVTSMPVSEEKEEVVIRRREKEPKVARKPDWVDDDNELGWADYNRVDGLTLGMQFPKPGWWADRNHHFALIGRGGYSFASKYWQYQIGLERWSGSDFRFAVGGEYHNMTDTQDRWIICDHENTLAALFLKEDFRDYYRRRGFSFWASQNFSRYFQVKAGYQHDDFTNAEARTNWALFGKKKNFRDNPWALPSEFVDAYGFEEPMTLKTLTAVLTIDSRNDRKTPTRGWYVNAFGERAGKELGNPVGFERYIVEVAHYIPLNWDEHLSIRLRGASAGGILPPLYWFDLGGISTLRGYRLKEFTGDRLVLGNAEYHLRAGDGNLLGLDIIFFVDSGLAWFVNPETPELANRYPVTEQAQEQADRTAPQDGFERLNWSSLKTDVGIGLADPDGDFRVDFARRIDKGGQDFIVTIRLCRAF